MDLFIILLLAFGLLYLMTGRSRKAQRQAASFRAELAPGQEVMTGSGLFATVVDVDGDVVVLETSPGVTTRWLRAAISKPASPADHTAPEEDEEEWDESEEGDEAYEGEDAYEDSEYDDEYDDDEYDDEAEDDGGDEVEDETLVAEGDVDVEVPDDASSLTDDDDRR